MLNDDSFIVKCILWSFFTMIALVVIFVILCWGVWEVVREVTKLIIHTGEKWWKKYGIR